MGWSSEELRGSPEAVPDVGVMGVQVSRQGTAQCHGQSHGPVRRVVDPRPGGEHGAGHEDDAVEVRLSDHGTVDQVLHTGRPHSLCGNKNFLIFRGILF